MYIAGVSIEGLGRGPPPIEFSTGAGCSPVRCPRPVRFSESYSRRRCDSLCTASASKATLSSRVKPRSVGFCSALRVVQVRCRPHADVHEWESPKLSSTATSRREPRHRVGSVERTCRRGCSIAATVCQGRRSLLHAANFSHANLTAGNKSVCSARFSTNANAPAARAAGLTTAFSEVIKMVLVRGSMRVSSRHASIQFMFGMCRSRRMRSGCNRAASSSTRAPSSTLPTTSKSCATSSRRIAALIPGWSSATTTRHGVLVVTSVRTGASFVGIAACECNFVPVDVDAHVLSPSHEKHCIYRRTPLARAFRQRVKFPAARNYPGGTCDCDALVKHPSPRLTAGSGLALSGFVRSILGACGRPCLHP